MARRILSIAMACALAGCGRSPENPSQTQSVAPAPAGASPAVFPTLAASQASVDELVAAANEMLQARDLQGALHKLSEAIAQSPQRADLYLKRAGVASESRMFSTAILDMNAAIKLDPQNPRLFNTRGYFHLVSEQLERAEQDFNDAIGLDLSYPQPYNNRGLVALARKNFPLAVKEFDNALRISPEYADALNNRGFVQIQQENFEEAEKSLTRAIELNPKFLNAITNRGRARMLMGHYDDAAADFSAAIGLQPQQLSYYVSRAEAYRSAGKEALAKADAEHVNWTGALLELNQRIAHNPRLATPWLERAQLFLEHEDRAAARESYRNVLNLEPVNREALMGMVRLDMADREFQKVVDACTALLRGGELFEARSLRGDAYLEMGQLNEAIADFQSTRRLDTQVISAYQQRAQQARGAGNGAQSEADEKMAESLRARLAQSAADSPVIHAAAPEFPNDAAMNRGEGTGVVPASAEMPVAPVR